MSDTALQRTTSTADGHGGELDRPTVSYNPDAPSEEWGWHGSWRVFAPRGSTILLCIGIFTLVMFNFTEHQSHVENYYFNAIALLGAIWVALRLRSARRMRRRQQQQAASQQR